MTKRTSLFEMYNPLASQLRQPSMPFFKTTESLYKVLTTSQGSEYVVFQHLCNGQPYPVLQWSTPSCFAMVNPILLCNGEPDPDKNETIYSKRATPLHIFCKNLNFFQVNISFAEVFNIFPKNLHDAFYIFITFLPN